MLQQVAESQIESAAPALRPKIELCGAGKAFQVRGAQVRALQPTDMCVRSEEFVALVGPSGCGKSTVLNLVAGLLQPTEGKVRYDNQDVDGPNRKVGYLTQKDTLLPWRTTADNIRLALELKCRSVSRREADDRVAQMVELVGLKGFEQHFPGELSGGMRKRAALARTLIYEPETLLMDEPFGALDAQLKLVMLAELQRLTQQRRMTVMFVTHDLGEAISVADRILVFSARPGRIRASSTVAIARPRDVFKVRFTEAFARLHEELWAELQDDVLKGTDV